MKRQDFKPRLELTERQHLAANVVMFQSAWLICVLAGSIAAVLVTAVVLTLHLQWVRDRRRELVFLAQTLAIGFLCDLSLIQSGVLITGGALPPLWLTCLWPLFGSTIGYAMRPFHGRLSWCVVGGAALAPLSYYGGVRLSGIAMMEPVWLALAVISLVWAVVLPLLVHLYTVNRLRPAVERG